MPFRLFRRNPVRITQDNARELKWGVKALVDRTLLVGIPEDRSQRDATANQAGVDAVRVALGGKSQLITNAALGYIHENGAPEAGIPPRPFLVPGVQAAREKIIERMRKAGEAALDGRPDEVARQFQSCGIEVVSTVVGRVEDGLTPPLSDDYRRRRDRASNYGRDAHHVFAYDLSQRKPLIDTGALMKSVTWVERVKGKTVKEGEKAP